MNRRAILLGILLACRAGAGGPLGAQESRRLDLVRYAWATPDAERGDRRELEALIASLSRGTPPRSLAAFGRLLREADSVVMLTSWHGDYWHLHGAVDTRDRSSAPVEDSLYRLQDSALAGVRRGLAALDSAQVARWFLRDTALARYRSFVAGARQAHTEAGVPVTSDLESSATGWQFDLYERVLDRTVFGSVPGPSGPLDVRRQWLATQASPDSAARQEAFERLYVGLAQIRDLLAFAVVATVRGQNAVARAHGFPDRPSQVYAGRGLSTTAVKQAIAAVRTHGELLRRFESAASAAQRVLHGAPATPLTLDQALAAMRGTYAGFGPEYADEAALLLDRSSGLLDISGGGHRRTGGFSFVLPGDLRSVYLDHFGGTPVEVSRLMHESGHALHRRLYYRAGVPHFADAPFGEAVALFGEILLAEQLGATAATAADSLAWQTQFLKKMLEVFYGARDAELEQTIYDSVAAGMAASADALDRLTWRVDSVYTADRRPELAGRWMRVRLLVEDPLYLSNYLTSGRICLELYRQYRTDPARFTDRYLSFLRDSSGGSAEDAITGHFGVRLDEPGAQAGALALLDSLVGRFEAQVAGMQTH